MKDNSMDMKTYMKKLQYDLECTDKRCADVLEKTDEIKLVNKGKEGYVWDKKSSLWKHLESMTELRTAVSGILIPIMEKKLDELRSMLAEGKETNSLLSKFEKKILSLERTQTQTNIINQMGNCVVSSSLFDSKIKDLLYPIGNEVLDIKTLHKRYREKSDYFTFALDVYFDEGLDTSEAVDFFKTYCPKKDEKTLEVLLRTCGYVLSPSMIIKAFFVWWGPEGNNGKSFLIELLGSLIGKLHTPVSTYLFSAGKDSSSDSATPSLMKLVGKVFATYTESDDQTLDEGLLKALSGKDKVQIRGLHKESTENTFHAHIVMAGNGKVSWSSDAATNERAYIFPFMNKFVKHPTQKHHRKEDKKMASKIMNNRVLRNKIFTLLMQKAHLVYKTEEIGTSPYIEKYRKIYLSSMQSVNKFVKQLVIKPKAGHHAQELFMKYKNWCKANNLNMQKKGELIEAIKNKFNPRNTKLNGNTVYDIDISETEVDDSNETSLLLLQEKVGDLEKEIEKKNKEIESYREEIEEKDIILNKKYDEIEDLKERINELMSKKRQKTTKNLLYKKLSVKLS